MQKRLNSQEILAIKKSKKSVSKLANKYDVSATTIRYHKKREKLNHRGKGAYSVSYEVVPKRNDGARFNAIAKQFAEHDLVRSISDLDKKYGKELVNIAVAFRMA